MKTLTPAKMVMLVFVAIGMLITFYLVKTLTAQEPAPSVSTTIAPLTLTEVRPGTVLTLQHVGMGPVPSDEIIGDVILGVEALVGRVVKNTIPGTEMIRGRDLYPAGELPPLKVVDGFTAVTIAQSETAAMVEGLIQPDDHVDIYYSPEGLSSDERYQEIGGLTIKLFKGVRVIAINRSFVQGDLETSRNSVTVQVRNKDAALLQLAANTGKLSLSYTKDHSGEATVQVADPDRPTLEEILQLPPIPEEPEEPEPDRYTTTIWRRGSRQSQAFVNGVPTTTQFDYDQLQPRVPGVAPPGYGQPGYVPPGYGPPAGAGGYPGVLQPNGAWSPQLVPQPGTVPQGPPPGQERFNPAGGI